MGREQPLTGDSGENLALDLLRRSFLTPAKTQSGAPTDWVCRELRARSGSEDLYSDPTLNFHFQIKTTERGGKFAVSGPTFRSWLALFEYQPVIIIFIEPIKVGKQRYWFQALHDWILRPQGQKALTAPGRGVELRIEYGFTLSDDEGQNFHNKMLEEAERASASLSSPWATLRDYGLYPLDESAFLQYMELAPFAEAPLEISKQLALQGTRNRHLVNDLMARKNADQNSLLAGWIKELQSLAPQAKPTSFQRAQFQHFANALTNHRKVTQLPKFRIAELNCWRSFVAMYPHSLNLLEHVAVHSKREDEVCMFLSALLPLLALSTNSAVSDRAWHTIRTLQEAPS